MQYIKHFKNFCFGGSNKVIALRKVTFPLTILQFCKNRITKYNCVYTTFNLVAIYPNLHNAFYKDLICIDENYKVFISNAKVFTKESNDYLIHKFEIMRTLFCKNPKHTPFIINFEKHQMTRFNKKQNA